MTTSNSASSIRSQIARTMEQAANISADTIDAAELAAHRICQSFAAGSRLLTLASRELNGLNDIFRYELIQQYKHEQPSLPIVVLQAFDSEQALSPASLHEASTLASAQDCLLVVGNPENEETYDALATLASHRSISVILLGNNMSRANADAQMGLTQPFSEHFISVGINTDDIYSRRELSLFLLHCISDRIQSILFRGEALS